jgi:hypothetical protein
MTENRQSDLFEPAESGDEAFIRAIAKPLRTAEALDASFEARVMSAVHAERPSNPVTSPWSQRWWTSPRTITVTPLGGLALAAGLAAVLLVGRATLLAPANRTAGAVASAPATVQVVRFVVTDPAARSVSLVGDFNFWDKQATPLSATGVPGVWSVSLPLPAGRHEYAFIITGGGSERWVADPFTLPIRDEFGTETSVITVSADKSSGRGPA